MLINVSAVAPHHLGDKEAKAAEKKKQDIINKIMKEMWKYSQTYEYAVVDPSGQTKKESAWCKFFLDFIAKKKDNVIYARLDD